MTSFFSAWLQKSTEIREHCSEALRGCCGITVVPLCVAPISREYIQDHSPHISMACFQIVVIGYGWNTVKRVSNRWRRFVRHSALIQGVVRFIFFPSIRYRVRRLVCFAFLCVFKVEVVQHGTAANTNSDKTFPVLLVKSNWCYRNDIFLSFLFLLSKSKIKPFRGLFAASLELRQIVGF